MARCKLSGAALAAVLGLLLGSAPASAQSKYLKTTATGDPQVQSIEAISFGPQGLLLIGDGKGTQVVAIDTGDTTPKAWTKSEIPQITEVLAGRIGTTAKGIEILKLAVNPASTTAYIAVRKLDDKKSLVLTIDGTGKVNELRLDNVKYARAKLPAEKGRTYVMTDVIWAGDRIMACAQANETFGSKIFSIRTPLENDAQATTASTETYHVAHGKWETRAPIKTVLPYEEDGKKYVVGAFTCTPLVKYPVDGLEDGAKVKGQTVIELGHGNHPRDMFTYKKGGKGYILMSTFRMFHQKQPVGWSPYWTVRIDQDLLRETAKVNEKAPWRVKARTVQSISDRAVVVDTYHGVMHMDQLDSDRALVVRTDKQGNVNLSALALP